MESFLGHPLHCGSRTWCQALPVNEKRGNLTRRPPEGTKAPRKNWRVFQILCHYIK
jgi:hypothetical protein